MVLLGLFGCISAVPRVQRAVAATSFARLRGGQLAALLFTDDKVEVFVIETLFFLSFHSQCSFINVLTSTAVY